MCIRGMWKESFRSFYININKNDKIFRDKNSSLQTTVLETTRNKIDCIYVVGDYVKK